MTQKWVTVARKDFEDAARSLVLWLVIGIFTLLVAVTTVLPSLIPDVEATPSMGLSATAEFAGILVPITALVAAYLAIAGERESGSIKVLLGLPATRRDVLLGKLVGRTAVVLVAVVVAFAVAAALSIPLYGSVPVGGYLAAGGLTGLLAVSFVAIAVGISAATSTRGRAMASAIAFYVVAVVLWDAMLFLVHFLVVGAPPGNDPPTWFQLLGAVTPTGAYQFAVTSTVYGGGTPTNAPFYLQGWFMLVLLVAWTLVPLALGYLQFRRADLG